MVTVAIDIDLTVCDVGTDWWDWLNTICQTSKVLPLLPNYDLSVYFEEELKSIRRCGYDYFRQSGLYDRLSPIKGSTQALKELKDSGNRIVFVSQVKGDHGKSKVEFIKRYFPYRDGIVLTKEKQYVRCDVLIDDRISHLNKQPDSVQCIRFDTPYTQDAVVTRDIKVLPSWDKLGELMSVHIN